MSKRKGRDFFNPRSLAASSSLSSSSSSAAIALPVGKKGTSSVNNIRNSNSSSSSSSSNLGGAGGSNGAATSTLTLGGLVQQAINAEDVNPGNNDYDHSDDEASKDMMDEEDMSATECVSDMSQIGGDASIGHRRANPAYIHFRNVLNSNKRMFCKHCEKLVKYNASARHLQGHLVKFHDIVCPEPTFTRQGNAAIGSAKEGTSEPATVRASTSQSSETKASTKPKVLQTSISKAATARAAPAKEASSTNKNVTKQTKNCPDFLTAYLRWVIMDCQPYNMCEAVTFREMTRCVNPSAPLISEAMVVERLRELCPIVKAKVSSEGCFAFICQQQLIIRIRRF
jgi:hypothetical protein